MCSDFQFTDKSSFRSLNINISAAAGSGGGGVVPAEPEDDVPHGVHDTAGHPATLLLLLLGQTWNILNINQ